MEGAEKTREQLVGDVDINRTQAFSTIVCFADYRFIDFPLKASDDFLDLRSRTSKFKFIF